MGLVVAGDVAEEFAGGGVEDADVEVVDEEDDGGAGVAAADADVVQATGVAQGDDTGGVDVVVANAVVGSGLGEQVVDEGVRRSSALWGRRWS